ncbi:MAG: transcriptional activator, Baf family [Gemmatimonadetes bacterium]|nr:transcriptional activator, Baf family [Gemmatimonadota bacterium]
MLLTFDVGNSETTLGLFDGVELRAHWRVMTDVPRTSDEVGVLLRSLIAGADVALEEVTSVAIASVVRGMGNHLVEASKRWLPVTRLEVFDATSPLPITLDVDEPLTVGADRIINTLVASRRYQRDCIVVDLGTATTFDCITRDGVFLGGVIAPGVRTSAETLFRRTSKLPATELIAPQHTIGKRTEDCIRAGVMFGQAESIDGLVRRIMTEWPRAERPMVIGTGGLAELFSPICKCFDAVDPYLTLHGLRMAFDLVSA